MVDDVLLKSLLTGDCLQTGEDLGSMLFYCLFNRLLALRVDVEHRR